MPPNHVWHPVVVARARTAPPSHSRLSFIVLPPPDRVPRREPVLWVVSVTGEGKLESIPTNVRASEPLRCDDVSGGPAWGPGTRLLPSRWCLGSVAASFPAQDQDGRKAVR